LLAEFSKWPAKRLAFIEASSLNKSNTRHYGTAGQANQYILMGLKRLAVTGRRSKKGTGRTMCAQWAFIYLNFGWCI